MEAEVKRVVKQQFIRYAVKVTRKIYLGTVYYDIFNLCIGVVKIM
jgi:hypothetical protein